MSGVNATEARRTLFELMDRAVRGHEAVTIRHKDGDVVMMAEEDYEGLLETLELLSAPGFRKGLKRAEADVAAGRVHSMEEVFGQE